MYCVWLNIWHVYFNNLQWAHTATFCKKVLSSTIWIYFFKYWSLFLLSTLQKRICVAHCNLGMFLNSLGMFCRNVSWVNTFFSRNGGLRLTKHVRPMFIGAMCLTWTKKQSYKVCSKRSDTLYRKPARVYRSRRVCEPVAACSLTCSMSSVCLYCSWVDVPAPRPPVPTTRALPSILTDPTTPTEASR